MKIKLTFDRMMKFEGKLDLVPNFQSDTQIISQENIKQKNKNNIWVLWFLLSMCKFWVPNIIFRTQYDMRYLIRKGINFLVSYLDGWEKSQNRFETLVNFSKLQHFYIISFSHTMTLHIPLKSLSSSKCFSNMVTLFLRE